MICLARATAVVVVRGRVGMRAHVPGAGGKDRRDAEHQHGATNDKPKTGKDHSVLSRWRGQRQRSPLNAPANTTFVPENGFNGPL